MAKQMENEEMKYLKYIIGLLVIVLVVGLLNFVMQVKVKPTGSEIAGKANIDLFTCDGIDGLNNPNKEAICKSNENCCWTESGHCSDLSYWGRDYNGNCYTS